jgi:hypothetical protein
MLRTHSYRTSEENIMNTLAPMLETHPRAATNHNLDLVAGTVEALGTCIQSCITCADACLAEENVQALIRCIRIDLDCADICNATARILSRQTGTVGDLVHQQLHTCLVACQACGDECESHGKHHEHCRFCAGHCRHCQELCTRLLGELSPSGMSLGDPTANPSESPALLP